MDFTLSEKNIVRVFMFFNHSFTIEEVGCRACEQSLLVRYLLLKRWVVNSMSIISK
jgi:hypothetical protein